MIVLALETTTDRLSVAARRISPGESAPRGPARDSTAPGCTRRSSSPWSSWCSGSWALRLGDVEVLALADGPGSFTGLRVGAAAAKALVRACPGLSVTTASTLLVRAAGVMPPHGARVLVVTSALRGELYAASYRLDLPNTVETLRSPAVASPESLHRETPDLLVADAPDKLVDRLA